MTTPDTPTGMTRDGVPVSELSKAPPAPSADATATPRTDALCRSLSGISTFHTRIRRKKYLALARQLEVELTAAQTAAADLLAEDRAIITSANERIMEQSRLLGQLRADLARSEAESTKLAGLLHAATVRGDNALLDLARVQAESDERLARLRQYHDMQATIDGLRGQLARVEGERDRLKADNLQLHRSLARFTTNA